MDSDELKEMVAFVGEDVAPCPVFPFLETVAEQLHVAPDDVSQAVKQLVLEERMAIHNGVLKLT